MNFHPILTHVSTILFLRQYSPIEYDEPPKARLAHQLCHARVLSYDIFTLLPHQYRHVSRRTRSEYKQMYKFVVVVAVNGLTIYRFCTRNINSTKKRKEKKCESNCTSNARWSRISIGFRYLFLFSFYSISAEI